MNISSESPFGQGGSSASSAIDGEDSIFDRGLTDFMDGSPAGGWGQYRETEGWIGSI